MARLQDSIVISVSAVYFLCFVKYFQEFLLDSIWQVVNPDPDFGNRKRVCLD